MLRKKLTSTNTIRHCASTRALTGLNTPYQSFFASTVQTRCHSIEKEEATAARGSSVDPEEIKRLSDHEGMRWWDPNGSMAPLHRMNPVRVAYIRMALCKHFKLNPLSPTPLKGLNIADIGCGSGLLSEPLARLGANVIGVDASLANINAAKKHAKSDPTLTTLEYRHGTAEELVRENKQFDVVCSLEVVEHVTSIDDFIYSCCDLIKPGGSVFLSSINRTALSYLLAIVMAEYVLRWIPTGTHTWRKFVQPSELALLLHRKGLNVQEVTGMQFHPLTGNWYVSAETHVNYILWATKKLQEEAAAGEAVPGITQNKEVELS